MKTEVAIRQPGRKERDADKEQQPERTSEHLRQAPLRRLRHLPRRSLLRDGPTWRCLNTATDRTSIVVLRTAMRADHQASAIQPRLRELVDAPLVPAAAPAGHAPDRSSSSAVRAADEDSLAALSRSATKALPSASWGRQPFRQERLRDWIPVEVRP